REPYGVEDLLRQLCHIVEQTTMDVKTKAGLLRLKAECLDWLRIVSESGDDAHRLQLFHILAEISLKLNDKPLMAQVLPGLACASLGTPHQEYLDRLFGAYITHRQYNHNRQNDPDGFAERVIANYLANRANFKASVERGRRMSLRDAVSYAINH